MPVGTLQTHVGMCAACEHDNDGHGAILWPVDNDNAAPWVCESCYYDANESYPQDYPADPSDEDSGEGDTSEWDAYANESRDDPACPPSTLHFAEPFGARARLISVEQEVGRGGSHIAQMLYNAGLAEDSHMQEYHGGDSRAFVRVEEDTTVAGEIIWAFLDPHSAHVMGEVERGQGVVRQCMNDGTVKLDMRCGFHIHVDAAGLMPRQLAGILHLWNHVEDTMFRLASANWDCHRTERANHNYAPKAPKGAGSTREACNLMSGDRHALNFSGALNARQDCRCGATRFGLWEECECELGRNTVEFRVFNATANPRKWRAYIALALAIVAYAETHEPTADELEPFEWNEDSGDLDEDRSRLALQFILTRLSLTPEDREAVLYCAERSSLAPVVADVREMLPHADQLALV